MNSGQDLSITFVLPRYGKEVVGGAEGAARSFAEKLAALGVRTKVLTTTALSIDTWEHHFEVGTTEIDGVVVHRFKPELGRSRSFPELSEKVLFLPSSTPMDLCTKWVEAQGPVSNDLLEAIASDTSDLVVFYPYLYHPMIYGLPLVRERSVLHPAAHPEPPLYLKIYREIFESARAIVLQSDAELELVNKTFRVGATRQIQLGLGVDGPTDTVRTSLKRTTSELGPPYVLCLGRVDDHKGTTMLADFFIQYKERNPSSLKLLYAGPVVVDPPKHKDIEVLGVVSEEEKWGLINSSQVVISPSYFEAFSIVLFEAWALKRPVIVNQTCGPTYEHVLRSGGGLWFNDYATFEVSLDKVLLDEALRNRLGELGNDYHQKNFTWDKVIQRYLQFLLELKAHL